MNIKNITLGILAACFLVACSKDDKNDPEPVKDGKAQVSIRTQIRGNKTTTKAIDENALQGETTINNMTAFAFNEDGSSLVGMKQVNQNAGLDIQMEVPSDVKLKLLIVANAPVVDLSGIGNLSSLENLLADLTSQSQSNLTFSTPLVSLGDALDSQSANYIGYADQTNIEGLEAPLVLTRIAARVEVSSVKTRFAGTALAGYSVRIDHVSLANVHTKSHYYSVADWGKVEADGNMVYGSDLASIAGSFATGSTPVDYLGANFENVINDGNAINSVLSRAYAFENLSAGTPTLIVIKATLLGENRTKYFTVPINKDGIQNNNADHDYVKRNYIYRLHITFGGNSFEIDTPEPPEPPVDPVDPVDPDPSLDVEVDVVGWGSVHQVEDV